LLVDTILAASITPRKTGCPDGYALTPNGAAISVEQHRESCRLRHVGVVDVQLDLQTIREVVRRLVEHYMAAGDEENAPLAREEEPACVCQRALPREGQHARCREQ
jgi:hypothetical protein